MFLIVVVVLAEARVLNKGSQHLASSLQQRVSSNTIKDTMIRDIWSDAMILHEVGVTIYRPRARKGTKKVRLHHNKNNLCDDDYHLHGISFLSPELS